MGHRRRYCRVNWSLLQPTTRGEQTPSGVPVSYGPTSPPTQWYRLDTPRPPLPAQCQRGGSELQGEVRDLLQEAPPVMWGVDEESQLDNDEIDLTQNAEELQSAAPSRSDPVFELNGWPKVQCRTSDVSVSTRTRKSLNSMQSEHRPPNTPGEAQLGSGARQSPHTCFGQPPGLPEVPSRPLPPMSSTGPSVQTTTACRQSCPRIWQALGSRPKCPPSSSPPGFS